MDRIHWKTGWEQRPLTERLEMARDVQARDRWVFEGGLSATHAERLARADTFVWLDLPVGLRFWRVLKRTIRDHGKHRLDMAEGCHEGFHKETLPFWHRIWVTRKSQRNSIADLVSTATTTTRIVHLCSPRDVQHFLDTLDPRIHDDTQR